MEVLSPGMKHGQKTDLSAQTFGVGRNREQRFRRGAKQDAIDLAAILKRQSADLMRKRKYNMEVRDRQQFCLPSGQPLGARHGLTLWAMSIPTRVIRDDTMPARIALIHILHMAAESGRAAHFDGAHDAPLPRGHRRAMLFAVGFAIAAEHVRHFQLRTIHEPRRSKMLRRCGLLAQREQGEAAGRADSMPNILLLVAIRR